MRYGSYTWNIMLILKTKILSFFTLDLTHQPWFGVLGNKVLPITSKTILQKSSVDLRLTRGVKTPDCKFSVLRVSQNCAFLKMTRKYIFSAPEVQQSYDCLTVPARLVD